MTNANHPVEELRERIVYNPATGTLTWKERPPELFYNLGSWKTWNGQFANKRAGDRQSNVVRYKDRNYRGYNLAWALYYGEHPTRAVLHRDGDKWNNKIDNLYLADEVVDTKPRPTDHPDITYHPSRELYRAVYRGNIALGYFKSYEKAEQAWNVQDDCYV